MSYGLDPRDLDRLYRKGIAPRTVPGRIIMVAIMLFGAALLVFVALFGGWW